MKEIIYIVLGWLLGIISPGITNHISNYYKKKTLVSIIIKELNYIKKILANIPFSVLPRYGSFDIDSFKWVKKQTNNFKYFEIDKKHKDELEKLAENEDLLISSLKQYNAKNLKNNPTFHFKKITLNILDSNINNFGLLENVLLEKLLEIKFQISTYNEEIQAASELLKMTFDSNISNDNYGIVSTEIKNKNFFIVSKAKFIVEKINKVLDLN